MPFIPHTQVDIDEMLAEIGIDQLDALFDEIPAGLISDRLDNVPDGMSEMAMLQYMTQHAEQDQGYTCFLGGGMFNTDPFGTARRRLLSENVRKARLDGTAAPPARPAAATALRRVPSRTPGRCRP